MHSPDGASGLAQTEDLTVSGGVFVIHLDQAFHMSFDRLFLVLVLFFVLTDFCLYFVVVGLMVSQSPSPEQT